MIGEKEKSLFLVHRETRLFIYDHISARFFPDSGVQFPESFPLAVSVQEGYQIADAKAPACNVHNADDTLSFLIIIYCSGDRNTIRKYVKMGYILNLHLKKCDF